MHRFSDEAEPLGNKYLSGGVLVVVLGGWRWSRVAVG